MASTSRSPDVKPRLAKSLSSPANQTMSTIPKVSQRPPLNRSLTRTENIKESITSGTANFFGIPGTTDYQSSMQKWNNRRMRHCSRRYGGIKEFAGDEGSLEGADFGLRSGAPTPLESLAPDRRVFGESAESGINSFGRTISVDSRSAIRKRANTLTRRDSVAKMAWDGLSSFVKSPARKRPAMIRKQKPSRSFSPYDVGVTAPSEDSVFDSEVTPGSAPITPQSEFMPTFPPSAPAIFQMSTIAEHFDDEVVDGVARLGAPVTAPPQPEPRRSSMKGTRPHLRLQRTVTPVGEVISEASPLQDDVFFDITPMSSVTTDGVATKAPLSNVQFYVDTTSTTPPYPSHEHVHVYFRPTEPAESEAIRMTNSIRNRNNLARREYFKDLETSSRRRQADETNVFFPNQIGAGLFRSAGARPPTLAIQPSAERPTVKKIWSRLLSTALNNSDRRVYGEGVVGRFFGRRLKKRSELSLKVQEKLDDFDDYRPFFTYWVTIVQVLVLIFSLASYGFGPFGFGRTQYAAMVLQTSLVLEQVAYYEKENIWIGPRYADLVHLGAKYSPCMRRDRNIFSVIDQNKEIEKGSACCIRNDRTGCVQTTQAQCPSLLSVWNKWNGSNSPENRTSGSVCNQDPRECIKPPSKEPFKWPDDITKWPICKESVPVPRQVHTKCELTGRPCCFGIVGECRISTREYCDFVHGYFHEEATLCSQVSCLGEVCGMIPFVSPDYPNQFYRLFISIFLHAGLVHIMFTVLIQFLLMRDLEKLIGWFRLAVIYLGSGVGGNLASAVFVPYETEVGPAGCQFGLLAALFVDAIYSWRMIVKPWSALLQLSGVAAFLFTIGLLPWIDNWAHAFGFMFGGLLSLALFPYIQINKNDHKKRIIIVVLALCIVIGLFGLLLTLFYFNPLWECSFCVYFNCIPFTDHFCDNKGLWLNPLPF